MLCKFLNIINLKLLRIFTAMGISISFVYFSEFFPTSVRCIGLAAVFSMESVGIYLF